MHTYIYIYIHTYIHTTLGGSYDLVPTYNWAYKSSDNWANLCKNGQGDDL